MTARTLVGGSKALEEIDVSIFMVEMIKLIFYG
jgi:hypothetical protein